MTPQTPSSRPSAGWVTALTDRYNNDPFFRVYVQMGLLQAAITLLVFLLLFGGYLYLEVSAPLLFHSIEGRVDPVFIAALHDRRRLMFALLFVGFLFVSTLFSVLISRVALRPTRNTLSFQKRFIGNIAHEIRTPLAIIKTSTEVALFDPSLPKSVRETMEETISELNRISETINNLLSFNRLTTPKEVPFDPVNLADVARSVAERHQQLAESRGIALEVSGIENAIVNGNATALEQVVTNLTKNALNYTPANKNGRVTIEVDRTQQGGVSVAVIDTGIGIDQKDLYHVFEPFYRADTSRARGIGTGTSGLGLAIVNEIVRMHHGTITLRSAVGHGTTIKVAFPPYKEVRQQLPLMSPSGSPHEATLDFS